MVIFLPNVRPLKLYVLKIYIFKEPKIRAGEDVLQWSKHVIKTRPEDSEADPRETKSKLKIIRIVPDFSRLTDQQIYKKICIIQD